MPKRKAPRKQRASQPAQPAKERKVTIDYLREKMRKIARDKFDDNLSDAAVYYAEKLGMKENTIKNYLHGGSVSLKVIKAVFEDAGESLPREEVKVERVYTYYVPA